jgi:hypothetical protein
LLRVEVPDGLAHIEPIRLSDRSHRGRAYSIGFPRLDSLLVKNDRRDVSVKLPPPSSGEPSSVFEVSVPPHPALRWLRGAKSLELRGEPARRFEAATQPETMSIAVGRRRPADLGARGRATYRLPSIGGSSGSPIVSARTHAMVALHSRGHVVPGQELSRTATGSTSRAILADLRARLRSGELRAEDEPLLLEIVRTDPSPGAEPRAISGGLGASGTSSGGL